MRFKTYLMFVLIFLCMGLEFAFLCCGPLRVGSVCLRLDALQGNDALAFPELWTRSMLKSPVAGGAFREGLLNAAEKSTSAAEPILKQLWGLICDGRGAIWGGLSWTLVLGASNGGL